jgi:hypothetical protein
VIIEKSINLNFDNIMKKIFYFIVLVTLSLLFVQCETTKIGQNGVHKGHEYVDLGLSVKWATCNVGATTPEGSGDYFAWGEVEPKDYYYWDSYKYCQGTEMSLTKYCHNKNYGFNGFVDNKFELDPEDDAASVNWGGKWRMPTADEFDDLRYSCTWEWTTQNGVVGLLGTSRIEGYTDRTIFFPAVACFFEEHFVTNTNNEFLWGWYWTKSVDLNDPTSAQLLLFQTEPIGNAPEINFDYSFMRVIGASVRAVCP